MTKPVDSDAPLNSLLGDLDSLRSTLKVVPAPEPPAPHPAADIPVEKQPDIMDIDDIPLLSDVVDAKSPVSENLDTEDISTENATTENLAIEKVASGNVALADNILEILLDEHWKSSYRDILDKARNKISKARVHWSRDRSEASAQTQIDNIDINFEHKIRAVVANSMQQHIEALREALLHSLKEEIDNIPELRTPKEDDAPRH